MYIENITQLESEKNKLKEEYDNLGDEFQLKLMD